MNIITDEEISQLWLQQPAGGAGIANCFARAIEAAIMAKFEVVAWLDDSDDDLHTFHYFFATDEAKKYCKPLYALKEKK